MPYNSFLDSGMPLMGPPEGKSLEIDKVSQNRLTAIKKIMTFGVHSEENDSRSHPCGATL